MKFPKLIFLVAGIYGLLVMLPQYFLEAKTGIDYPPAITHPEFFYGFIGVTVAWQVLFLVMSRDPVRFRPAIIPSIIEKAGFSIAALVLFLQHRLAAVVLIPAGIDVILGTLFVVAYVVLGRQETS
ncbi:MAG TPA: hypothetical protein VFD63_17850 [Pyrinomonadaceae bacterium]|nr:hypothetical protein [Pyrinomonadaceae bacterium]